MKQELWKQNLQEPSVEEGLGMLEKPTNPENLAKINQYKEYQ
jgi:hypothetical protein